MYGYIYKTTNLINQMIYIGQKHSAKFLGNSYLGSGKLIRKAIKKYGKENFQVDLLEEIDNKNLMDEREIFWIAYYNSTDHTIGYNISEGGFVNRTMKGENNPFFGRHHTLESKKKVSLSKKGTPAWNKGLTKETDSRILAYAQQSRGKPSLCAGTVWINNGLESKMVNPQELDSFLQNGWQRGRGKTMVIDSKLRGQARGKIRVHNADTEKLILPEEFAAYEKNGWTKGRLPFKKKNKGEVGKTC